VTEYFGFDKVLPMNTGAEAVETAIKLCRKWAYEVKGIAENKAKIIVCEGNFHGRTTTIVSFSSDPDSFKNFGPYSDGFIRIPYDDLEALENALKQENVAGFLVEPIQGEAGVYTPSEDFISESRRLCSKYNALLICDEVQTGIARTGSMLASCGNCTCESKCERQASYSKPDILVLGKAISGGVYPVSAVLSDDAVMNVIKPGQHGSTFGGNPIAAKVAIEALEVVVDEQLMLNARRLGEIFRAEMNRIIQKTDLVTLVRGKGLLNAIVINDTEDSSTAWDICMSLKENGLLAKPTHGNIIRFAPPLVMTEDQLMECVAIIEKTIVEFRK
jgi:ornithine--oxo-acid transaminase